MKINRLQEVFVAFVKNDDELKFCRLLDAACSKKWKTTYYLH